MFQRFHKDTSVGRFIKTLLSKHPVPIYDCVGYGDILIEGCYYIYGRDLIQCTHTGKLIDTTSVLLYPDEDVFPSAVLYPETGIAKAEFKVIKEYTETFTDYDSHVYRSNINWYDSETHQHLGNYLRYLKYYHKLDLMPFYNCYTDNVVTDLYLKTSSLYSLVPSYSLYPSDNLYPGIQNVAPSFPTCVVGKNPSYKVAAIPIKFGRKYTVAVECYSEVVLQSVIYNKSGMIQDPRTGKYYTDRLQYSYVSKQSTRYDEPFVYSVETTDKELYMLQKDLYLILQVPASCSSSICVLEGDYTNLDVVEATSNFVRIIKPYRNLSLLMYNTQESIAFSDRLVEYLLQNITTHLETLSNNISRIQSKLATIDPDYAKKDSKNHRGIWNDSIKRSLINYVHQNSSAIYFQDQDGYLNKDLEKLLFSD